MSAAVVAAVAALQALLTLLETARMVGRMEAAAAVAAAQMLSREQEMVAVGLKALLLFLMLAHQDKYHLGKSSGDR